MFTATQFYLTTAVLLIIFFFIPLLLIDKSTRKRKKDRKTELKLLHEQNELLRQIANNKGE